MKMTTQTPSGDVHTMIKNIIKPIINKRLNQLLILTLVVFGLWQSSTGLYIHIKAQAAQWLIRDAWSQTLGSTSNHKPWPWADTWPVAKLAAPSQGVELIALQGLQGASLAFGPGLIRSTNPYALHPHQSDDNAPGQETLIMAGHKDTHFRFLKDAHNGDTLLLTLGDGDTQTFTIRDRTIIDSQSATLNPDNYPGQLLLITCYPFNPLVTDSSLRLIVSAEPAKDSLH